MSLYPCSACGQRPQGKLSSVTWAWNLADGTRTAYRQRLCPSCFAQRILALPLVAYDGPLTCPGCGIDTNREMDPVYCTSFVPGFGRQDYEWPTCGACAVKYRSAAQEGAEHLENRQGQFGGLGPGPQTDAGGSPTAAWDSLGLAPVHYPS